MSHPGDENNEKRKKGLSTDLHSKVVATWNNGSDSPFIMDNVQIDYSKSRCAIEQAQDIHRKKEFYHLKFDSSLVFQKG